MANCYKVSPKNLEELMTSHISEVIEQLDKGCSVMITPDKWAGNQNAASNNEEEECNCPACTSRRETIKHFEGKYSREQLEEFFDSGEFPGEVAEYFEYQMEARVTEIIDSVLGEDLKNFPKERLVHIDEIRDLPNVSRFEIKPVVIDYHGSKSLPKDHLIISKAPALLKMVKPDCPDYLIVGNLDAATTANFRKSIESYRYSQALIKKLGDKVMKSDAPSLSGLSELLDTLMN